MATVTGAVPLATTLRQHSVVAAAVTTDTDFVLGRIPGTGVNTVTSVVYIPDAALTGADTNSRTLTLYNRKGDASGTTVVATLALVSGVNLVKWVPKALTLSAVAGALDLAAGDVLSFQSLHIGTGITDPGGTVEVTAARA